MTSPEQTLITAAHTERLSTLHTLSVPVGEALAAYLDRLVIQVEQAAVEAGHHAPRGGQVLVMLEVRYDVYASDPA